MISYIQHKIFHVQTNLQRKFAEPNVKPADILPGITCSIAKHKEKYNLKTSKKLMKDCENCQVEEGELLTYTEAANIIVIGPKEIIRT